MELHSEHVMAGAGGLATWPVARWLYGFIKKSGGNEQRIAALESGQKRIESKLDQLIVHLIPPTKGT